MWAPARIQERLSLLNTASAWAAKAMPLARKTRPSAGYVATYSSNWCTAVAVFAVAAACWEPIALRENNELVVDVPRVVEQGSDDALHAFDARSIEPWRIIIVGCQLLLGAVEDYTVLVGGELRLCGCLVPFAKQQVADVFVHRQAARAFAMAICVVPP